jgi:hypothetical protein
MPQQERVAAVAVWCEVSWQLKTNACPSDENE